MLAPFSSTILLLSVLSSASVALPTPNAAPEFNDILLLSPRDLVPAYVDKRDVPDYTAPKGLKQSIAYFPAISTPEQGSVWQAGSSLTVAWNNTVPDYAPEQIHNYATLLLGFRNPDDPASGLNLDVDHPLANVSLYGSADPIQVQLRSDLPTRSTYLLVLGSTANMSPLFTIEGLEEESPSGSSSQSSALATRTIDAAPVQSSSTITPEQQVSSTRSIQAAASPSSQAAAARLASPSSSAGVDSSEDESSPSPTAEGTPVPVVPASSPSTTSLPVQAQTSSSLPSTPSAASPISVSGGALAASATPTSGAIFLSARSSLSLFATGFVALVFMM